MDQKYADYAVEKAVELLGIDSPTGFTEKQPNGYWTPSVRWAMRPSAPSRAAS